MPAGRPRQPIDFIIAKGKKHLTKAEIEERQNSEVKVEATNVIAPQYLSKKQKNEFYKISNILIKYVGMSELDEDCLARYLISNENFIRFSKQIKSYLKDLSKKEVKNNLEKIRDINKKLEQLYVYQDRALKQCRACASDLGLSISSRARLVMPEPANKEPPKENKFARFKEA